MTWTLCRDEVRGDGAAGTVAARMVGGMFLAGACLNTVLAVRRPQAFRDLGAWFPAPAPARAAWQATFDAHPRAWGLAVGAGYEAVVGALSLSRSRRRRTVGLLGAGAFHLGLLALGLWAWALPVLAVVLWSLRQELALAVARRP